MINVQVHFWSASDLIYYNFELISGKIIKMMNSMMIVWIVDAPIFFQCSRSCESGTRSRPVVCARIEGNKIQEKHCRDKSKPEHEQQCNAQKCAGMWMTSEWSQCSVDCGQGVQQRHVLCMKNVNGNYKETFDSECSVDNKPAVRKECSRNCVPSWFATPWSQVWLLMVI